MAKSDRELQEFIARFRKACRYWYPVGVYRELDPFVEETLKLDEIERGRLVVLLFRRIREIANNVKETGERRRSTLTSFGHCAQDASGITSLAALMLRRKIHLTNEMLVELAADTGSLEVVFLGFMPQIRALVGLIEKRWNELCKNMQLRQSMSELAETANNMGGSDEQRLAFRIEQMMNPGSVFPVDAGEAWSDALRDDLGRMESGVRSVWIELLSNCRSASSSRPSAKWLKSARGHCDAIGDKTIAESLTRWLPLVDRPRTAPMPHENWHTNLYGDQFILDRHADILKGLCWVAGTIESEPLARALSQLAISCYRKIPGVGPRAQKIGNAAVYALGQMPGRASLGQLAMLRIKVKFGTAQKLLEKALDAAAEREGLPRDEIEEMAVPSYGLTDVGEMQELLGEYTASLRIRGTTGASSTSLTWIDPKGKSIKSTPAAVNRDHASDLKEIKASAKDIQRMLPAQRDRIDSLFLERKTWAYPTWRERYLDHPLVGTLARRLIWLFHDGRETVAAAWLADDVGTKPHGPGRLVRSDGTPFEPSVDATTVSLWHPIDQESAPGSTETRDDIAAWRMFYEERQIRQPFKQAHREIYLLTDAERNSELYSNRFAAHILRQHQFNALCGQRNWKNQLRLMVDAEYKPAHKILRTWNLRAEFWIEGVGDEYSDRYVIESGAFRYIASDQVRFYAVDAAGNFSHAYGGRYETRGPDETENHPLRIDRIPPIVLSEILRDVDLFVGVASVGNNPEWQDGGPDGVFRDYWHAYSFGELSGTAQTRREFLKRLVPRLKIASACTVTDRFLVVLGKKRTYKIHLGSGNIQMEPNDQYLCIVPNSRMEAGPQGGKLFLPFEGDRTLAIILSKAFLLAEDDKITDRTILSQIGR